MENTLPAKIRFIVKNCCIWILSFVEAWSGFVNSHLFAYFLAGWREMCWRTSLHMLPHSWFLSDANPEWCLISGRYQLYHPSLHLDTHTSTLQPIPRTFLSLTGSATPVARLPGLMDCYDLRRYCRGGCARNRNDPKKIFEVLQHSAYRGSDNIQCRYQPYNKRYGIICSFVEP